MFGRELTELQMRKMKFCKTCGKYFDKKDMKYSQYCSDDCKNYKKPYVPHLSIYTTRRVSRFNKQGLI